MAGPVPSHGIPPRWAELAIGFGVDNNDLSTVFVEAAGAIAAGVDLAGFAQVMVEAGYGLDFLNMGFVGTEPAAIWIYTQLIGLNEVAQGVSKLRIAKKPLRAAAMARQPTPTAADTRRLPTMATEEGTAMAMGPSIPTRRYSRCTYELFSKIVDEIYGHAHVGKEIHADFEFNVIFEWTSTENPPAISI